MKDSVGAQVGETPTPQVTRSSSQLAIFVSILQWNPAKSTKIDTPIPKLNRISLPHPNTPMTPDSPNLSVLALKSKIYHLQPFLGHQISPIHIQRVSHSHQSFQLAFIDRL